MKENVLYVSIVCNIIERQAECWSQKIYVSQDCVLKSASRLMAALLCVFTLAFVSYFFVKLMKAHLCTHTGV